mmetsp:Transcript_7478/g.18862  ORF Transcript_7478/g.18862 Transcript_7478/m.18862 type:complete len:348 (+) Transcript_7478:63-1106(+)|eukprot:CAMPEP_0115444078 /NCGR_PEP_ID=MMETSP0271-20121206/38203_1 /TAXON_ID=71861 /ORGANISM="Scrippsiella trochoidea, Strain CCMP3099" /LENGTH=347 /DNA_ID=CAMNT_0002869983 /DNA_START=56 /DNA_END=1099 /DNA_ORIENTATION=+
MAPKAVQSALRLLTRGPQIPALERCVSNVTPPQRAHVFAELRERLVMEYLTRTPSAVRAVDLLSARGARIHNDHVALRSFAANGTSGLTFLGEIFTSFGYAAQAPVTIPGLAVNARWFEPPEITDWPKIFISELRADELPAEASEIVQRHVGNYYDSSAALKAQSMGDASALVDLLETPPWRVSAEEEMKVRAVGVADPKLAGAAEYAAWTLTHAHRWNHLTILLNGANLPGVSTLADLNALLQAEDFTFNRAGGADGLTQGSVAVKLEQSSTKADLVQHTFSCGTSREVPCAFLELIHRHEGFRGFLGSNAKGIFSSTSSTPSSRLELPSMVLPQAPGSQPTQPRA